MGRLVPPDGGRVDDGDTAAYLKQVAEALRDTALVQREMFDFLRRAPQSAPTPRPSVSHRGPLNPRHQIWRSFVEDLQQLEAQAKREGLKLTKANVCRFGVDTAKTITRTMEWYGLDVRRDWPPSTWDASEQRAGGKNS